MLLLMANWGAGEALMVSVAVTDEVSPPPVMVAVMVMQYLGFRGHANAGDVIVDGVLTWDGGIYLLIFAFFALIIVNLLLKAWVDKRGGSAE